MEKCIFTTRFKECCKEKGFTQQEVAEKLNISINGLKHHLRSNNPHFPPLDLIIKMAEIFDVDIEYLVNEHRGCKNYKSQTICDVTCLNEESAEILQYIDFDISEILNEILSHPQFLYMLSEIVHFARFSRNEEFISQDVETGMQEPIEADRETQKALKKYMIIETFSKILDDLYDIHNDLDFEIEKLKDEYIDLISYAIEQNDDESFICSLIYEFQGKLIKLSPSDPLCYLSDDYFIQNIEKIMKER